MSKTSSAIPDPAAVILDANIVTLPISETVLCWRGYASKPAVIVTYLKASVALRPLSCSCPL